MKTSLRLMTSNSQISSGLQPFLTLTTRMPLPALEAFMVIAWSSGFVGMRFSTGYAPTFLVVFWRFAVLSVCLFPLVAREIMNTSPRVLLTQGGVGFFALAGYIAGVGKGIELGVSAGLSALIANLPPVGTVIISLLVFRAGSSRRVCTGIALGVGGVAIVSRDAFTLGTASIGASALPILGMMSLAIATVWRERSSSSEAPLNLLSTLWIHCIVSLFAFACLQGLQGSLMPIMTAGFGLSVAWTAILSTLGGYGLYWACLRRSSATRVSSVLFLSPSVTLVWAWAMFSEPLSWSMVVGTVVSGFGVLLMSRPSK
jgi:drug/metabolite transporter (DMT)-like permease